MVKKLGVSIPDWIYRDVIENNPGPNKSEWVAELLVKGYAKVQEDAEKLNDVAYEIMSRNCAVGVC